MSRRLNVCLVLLALLGGAGCSSLEPGPITRPERYPDRTGPDEVFHTFLYAWKTGDVHVLQQCTGGGLANALRKQLRAGGPEKTAAYWRDEALEVRELEWTLRGEKLANVRVVLRATRPPRAELIFGCVERQPQDWTVSGKKLIPRR